MEFLEAIEAIIRTVPSGVVFDSHFIINQLIKNHSDEYLTFACDYAQNPNMVRLTYRVHQQIGHRIKSFDGRLVRRIEGQDSWSENIHGNATKCAIWLRL